MVGRIALPSAKPTNTVEQIVAVSLSADNRGGFLRSAYGLRRCASVEMTLNPERGLHRTERPTMRKRPYRLLLFAPACGHKRCVFAYLRQDFTFGRNDKRRYYERNDFSVPRRYLSFATLFNRPFYTLAHSRKTFLHFFSPEIIHTRIIHRFVMYVKS